MGRERVGTTDGDRNRMQSRTSQGEGEDEGVGEGAGKPRKEGWGYKRHRGYCAGVHEVT